MMHSDLLLVIVVGTALAFDFTNGFHDTANVVATSISTRALSPRTAIAIASLLNFAGAFISLKVAATVATGIFDTGQITESIAFAGLFGAIAWNLITWAFGLPSSSSHALIGGVTGAMLAAVGGSGVKGSALLANVVIPALVAPMLAFLVAGVSILVIYRFVAHRRPGLVQRGFRLGQVLSGSMLALSHGTNDAQKTMGVISLALVAHGSLDPNHVHAPAWVVIAAGSAIALGTYAGGWRIIRTLGTRIMKVDSAQGFAAQSAGAAVILTSSHFGYPLSSTHVISGGIIGAGTAERVSAVRWGVAGNIALAWALTLPAAAAMGAVTYWIAT
jgi:PiT family inorganic phosphate transporter